MQKIRKAYERVIVWIIGTLAQTIVRPGNVPLVQLLNLQPLMHVIRGDNGVRFIGIYCDALWKSLNGFPKVGSGRDDIESISLIQETDDVTAPKRKSKTRRKASKR